MENIKTIIDKLEEKKEGYDLAGVEINEEDANTVVNEMNSGKSESEAIDTVLSAIRDCISQGWETNSSKYGVGAYVMLSWPTSQEFLTDEDCVPGIESGDVLVSMDEYEFDDDEVSDDNVYYRVCWPESQKFIGVDGVIMGQESGEVFIPYNLLDDYVLDYEGHMNDSGEDGDEYPYALYIDGDCVEEFESLEDAIESFNTAVKENPDSDIDILSADGETTYKSYDSDTREIYNNETSL